MSGPTPEVFCFSSGKNKEAKCIASTRLKLEVAALGASCLTAANLLLLFVLEIKTTDVVQQQQLSLWGLMRRPKLCLGLRTIVVLASSVSQSSQPADRWLVDEVDQPSSGNEILFASSYFWSLFIYFSSQ